MTTNFDRAAIVIAESITRDSAPAHEIVADLEHDRLLMPDLPEATHDGTWELPSGESIRVSRKGIQAGTTRTPAEARSYALALLAAADYAEEHADDHA